MYYVPSRAIVDGRLTPRLCGAVAPINLEPDLRIPAFSFLRMFLA